MPSRMISWCVCGNPSSNSQTSGDHARNSNVLSEHQSSGISLQSLIEVLTVHAPRGSSSNITPRQLIETVILPKTMHTRSAFSATLSAGATGQPMYYLSCSWDVPFELSVHALLQHLGLPGTLMNDNADGASDEEEDGRGDSVKETSIDNHLADTYIFVDFLSVNFWKSGSPSLPGASDVVGSFDMPSSRSRRGSVLGIRTRLHPSRTFNERSAETQLSQVDPEAFVMSVGGELAEELPVRALLLCLDPDLTVLSALVPMHAAWRAMRSRVPVQVIPGRSRDWPKPIKRNEVVFRLATADEPDSRLRDALLKDMREYVQIHSMFVPSTSSSAQEHVNDVGTSKSHQPDFDADEVSWQRALDIERCSLWKTLVRATIPSDNLKKHAINRHLLVRAVFLALDGQYKESRMVLSQLHLSLKNQGSDWSRRQLHVLSLLVGIMLEQGDLQSAEEFSRQGKEICSKLFSSGQGSNLGRRSSMSTPEGLSSSSLLGSDAPAVALSVSTSAKVLEAMRRPDAAEEVWRRTFIQLDQELGPRHRTTLDFMAHLGRNLSLLQDRHDEGLVLLRECLKSVRLETGHALLDSGTPYVSNNNKVTMYFQSEDDRKATHVSGAIHSGSIRPMPWQMRILTAELSRDVAVALRLSIKSEREAAGSALACSLASPDGCNDCGAQIMAAFEEIGPALDEPTFEEKGSEVEHLWSQHVNMTELACGTHHEASCLARIARAARIRPFQSDQLLVSTREGEEVVGSIEVISAELNMLEDILGPKHAITLYARTVLAKMYESMGLLTEAEEAWRKVVAGQRQSLGSYSIHLATSLTRQASCLSALGRHCEAAGAVEAAAEATSAAAGAHSELTGKMLLFKAKTLQAAGDVQGAEEALQAASDVHAQLFGKNNWRTKQVYSAFVEFYRGQGRQDEADSMIARYKLKGREV